MERLYSSLVTVISAFVSVSLAILGGTILVVVFFSCWYLFFRREKTTEHPTTDTKTTDV